jgi:predicted permease
VKVLPIVLIIAVGNIIRRRSILSEGAIDAIKGLVVNVALPAVLFVTFLQMELESAFLGLFATILVVCVVLFGYGYLLRRVFSIPHDYFPFLTTGFEFGMVGITLFGTAYGLSNVGYIAIVDLSHELFIWFVFATILTAKRDGVSSFGATMKGFVSSPLIIAIVLALILNLVGLGNVIIASSVGGALIETLGYLGDLLIPVILIIIGYGMRLSLRGVKDAAGVIIARLVVLIPLAFFSARFVVGDLLGLDPAFEAAVFTFFVLPPPYIVPLFMRPDQVDERVYANNVLSVYTVVSLEVFVLYFAFNPTLG